MVYSVRYRDKVVLEESTLGLDLEGGALLGAKVHVVNSVPGSVPTTTAWQWATRAMYTTRTRVWKINLAEDGAAARIFQIEARAYDSGVAFRYVVPEQPKVMKELRLRQEATQF